MFTLNYLFPQLKSTSSIFGFIYLFNPLSIIKYVQFFLDSPIKNISVHSRYSITAETASENITEQELQLQICDAKIHNKPAANEVDFGWWSSWSREIISLWMPKTLWGWFWLKCLFPSNAHGRKSKGVRGEEERCSR